jgi:hypothetical protein
MEAVLTGGAHDRNAPKTTLRFGEVMPSLKGYEIAKRDVTPFTRHNPAPSLVGTARYGGQAG